MMPAQFGSTKIGGMQYGGVTIGEAMMNGQIVYRSGPPVVRITATTYQGAFVQFRDALAAYGLDSATVEYLPFHLDTSQATDLSWMFVDCLALKTVPPMDLSNVTNTEAMFWSCNALESVPDLVTGNVVNAKNMFQNCVSLTDGNVRLLGKHPSVNTTGMLTNAALTREPWYSADGLRALVTPAAPTFLAASPWVTLPTQTGVTYTVSGTPGYSQTVTVNATAQAGYALAGKTSWTHTYPSFYPVSGTWPKQSGSGTGYSTFATHTIAEAGTFTINLAVLNQSSSFGQNISARISGPWGTNTGNIAGNGSTSTVSTTRALSPGNVIQFQAEGSDNKSGSWSIVKN